MSKSKFLILFALLVSTVSHAQWPLFNEAHPVSIQSPAYNYTAHGHFGSVIVIDSLPDYYDGYLLFGNGVLCHPDSTQNYMRKFSAKCNVNGEIMWWRRYDQEGDGRNEQWYNFGRGDFGGAIKDSRGKIVSMSTNYFSNDESGLYKSNYLVKLDIQGEIIDSYLVDSSADSHFFLGLTEDVTDSSYIAFGYLQDSLAIVNQADPNAMIMKLDSEGNRMWRRKYPDTFTVDPRGVYKAMDGGFWLLCEKWAGQFCVDEFSLNTDLVIIKTDSVGVEESRLQMGGYCGNELAYLHEFEMDKILIGGRLTEEQPGQYEYQGYFYTALIEQLSNGQLTAPSEMKEYMPSVDGLPSNFHSLENQQYLIVGHQYSLDFSVSPLIQYAFILKLDENRDSLWCRRYLHYDEAVDGDVQLDATYFIGDSKVMNDGGIVCVGTVVQGVDNPNPNLHTPWIFRVDSLGCLEPGCQFVDVQEVVVGLQNTMSIYPNPAVDMVHINFELSPHFHILHSKLVVINLQGQTVLEKELSPSAFIAPVDLNITDLAAGHYTVHWVSDGAWLDSVKMIKW